MKKILVIWLLFVAYFSGLSFGKPMESIMNYNIIMVHGAYGEDKGIDNCSDATVEASSETAYLTTSDDGANIGYYQEEGRLTRWLEKTVFEDSTSYTDANPFMDNLLRNQGLPYIYSWRAFVNPANSSINNAKELGNRTWKGCGKRRALVEEAQEVEAWEMTNDDGDPVYGQSALQIIRKNPDLYHQLASRYILIGHSMGGVAIREYLQGSNYNRDVDKFPGYL